PNLGELGRALGDRRMRRRRVERLERRAVHHQRDRDLVGAADALVVVLDVAEHEIDLVEIAQVIDHLALVGRRGSPARRATRAEQAACRRGDGRQNAATIHLAPPHFLVRIAASSLRSCTSALQSSSLARSSRNTRSSAPPSRLRPSSSGLLLRQMRIESSRTSVDFASGVSSTVMPPPSQSTPQPSCALSLAFSGRRPWPQSPLESKSPGRLRDFTPSRNE